MCYLFCFVLFYASGENLCHFIPLQTSPHQGVILQQRVQTHEEKKANEQESTEAYPLSSPSALTSKSSL